MCRTLINIAEVQDQSDQGYDIVKASYMTALKHAKQARDKKLQVRTDDWGRRLNYIFKNTLLAVAFVAMRPKKHLFMPDNVFGFARPFVCYTGFFHKFVYSSLYSVNQQTQKCLSRAPGTPTKF